MCFKHLKHQGTTVKLYLGFNSSTVLTKLPQNKKAMERYYQILVNELAISSPNSEEHLRTVERRLLIPFFKKGEIAKWFEGITHADPEFNGQVTQAYGQRLLDEVFNAVSLEVIIGAR